MADDKTLQQDTASPGTFIVPTPGPGQNSVISLETGQIPQIFFDPGTESTQEFAGTDLVFTMENGAVLTFEDFAANVNDGDVTSLMLADGTVIPISALMAAWNLEVPETAAGADVASGGSSEYRDDMGDALGGIDKLGTQNPDPFGSAASQIQEDEQTILLPDPNLSPTIQGTGGTVYESGLESEDFDGSGREPTDIVAEGTFTIGDPNALETIVSLSIDGVVLSIGEGGEFASLADMVGEQFILDHGTLELTGYVNGTFSYEYILTSPAIDVEGVTETDSFEIIVSDGELEASTTIDIVIEDDLPSVTVNAEYESEIILTTQDSETDGTPTDSDTATTTADFSSVFSNDPVYGADGPGNTTWDYTLSLLGADGGDSGLNSHGNDINLYDINGTIVGSTAGTIDEVDADNTIFSVYVDASGIVTLTQDQQVDHIEGGAMDDSIGLNVGLVTLSGMAITTDSDGDVATHSQDIDLGGNIRFTDDEPIITSVMDAVSSSAAGVSFTGLYEAEFGADGLDVMSVLLGSGGYLAGEPVTFVQQATVDNVTKVNVMDGDENLFSFYYTITENPVTENGDGSVVFNTFTDPNNQGESQFFVLTVNGDGTYDFDIVSNQVLARTTVTGSKENFEAFGPINEVTTLDGTLKITGDDITTVDDPGTANTDESLDLLNASKHGIGVDNPNITIGEWVEMSFLKADQSYVSFELQQWEGSGESLVHITVGETIFDDLLLAKPPGKEITMEVVVTEDSQLVGTWEANSDESEYTLYVGDEFDTIRVNHVDDVDGRSSFNLNNISYDMETTIDDLTVNFTLSTTDYDGDSHTLEDDLTIAMISPEEDVTAAQDGIDVDNGVVLAGNGEGETITGSDGNDILFGDIGNDTLTGGSGADHFIFNVGANNDGEDTIEGFNLGEDVLSFYDVLDSDTDENGVNDYFDNVEIELSGPGNVDVILHDNNSGTDITLEEVNSGGAFDGFVNLGDFLADDPAAINVETNPDIYAS